MTSGLTQAVPSDVTVLSFPGGQRTGFEPIPLPITPLLGREAEVASLRGLLREPDVRLVTLTGPGGVGKTRLALEIVASLGDAFPEGIVYVSLAAVGQESLVPTLLARAVGIEDTSPRPARERLHDALRGQQLLFVLDNFEHLLGAAPAVAGLLAACPGVKVLVTSRERLRLRGERNVVVAPLPLPDARKMPPLAALSEMSAIALFVDRAREANPDFSLSEENAPAVATICRRLDGLPLAIELAAPWTRVLPPAALLQRLESSLLLLTEGSRDLPERQRTLRDAIAWTYGLLTPDEQRVFKAFSVFAGGCSLEAATRVCWSDEPDAAARGDAGEAPEALVLNVLASLVEKHLLLRVPGNGGDPRFGVLETIRQFGWEQAETSGELAPARRRHALWMAALTDGSRRALDTPQEPAWFDRLEIEHDNLRAALAWADGEGERHLCLRLATGLRSFWFVRGYLGEGRERLERVLAMAGEAPADLWEEAMFGAGSFAYHQGDWPRARAIGDELLAAARGRGSIGGTVDALGLLGLVGYDEGELESAARHLSEAAELAQASGDDKWQALALSVLGLVMRANGDWDRAVPTLREADRLWRARGSAWGASVTSLALAMVALDQGDGAGAAALCRASLEARASGHDRWGVCQCLVVSAAIMQLCRDAAGAVRLLGAEAAARNLMGASQSFGLRQILESTAPAARQTLGETAYQAAWDAGQRLTLAEASGEALAYLEQCRDVAATAAQTAPGAASNRHGLTPREREVLRLMATGSSDREIADALFISRHTAMKHVANILAKLEVGSRTAAVAVAYQDDLT